MPGFTGVKNHVAVIFTALPVEYTAVRDHLKNLKEDVHPQGTIYERGIFSSNDQPWEVGIAEIGEGNEQAALEVERAIRHFNPSIILFVGVAGGVKDVELGDVVVASKVYGYESGKAGDTFEPRPEMGKPSYKLFNRARAESRKDDWLQRLGELVPNPHPTVFIKPIAAGGKVLSSTRSAIYKFIKSNYGDTLAVEMEGYGFLKAAYANPNVDALVIRGISDLIDEKEKADKSGSQKIASRHASAFAFEILAKSRIEQINSKQPKHPEITGVLNEKTQEKNFSSNAETPPPNKDPNSNPAQVLPPEPEQEPKGTISNVPYLRNPRFTGREDKLEQIREAFLLGNTVAVSQPVAVCGLGGIGKTQVAVEYTYRYRAEYQFIFWVKADSEDSIISSYVEIAKFLNLPVKNDSDQNNIVSAVLNWFRTHEKWLLVFDNADDISFVKNYLPPDPKGHILLTSRLRVFNTLDITKLVDMEEMSPEEAKDFLLKRTIRNNLDQSELDALEKLVHELGCLPLALEQAGAYIYANNSSFKDYLVSYKIRGLKLLGKSTIDKSKYPESIATTWLMNFEEVKKNSKVSADFLYVSAFLNPNEIPSEIFYKGANELGPLISAAFAEADEDPLVFDEILKPLWQYSLINRDAGSHNYDIHRLVQAVLKDGMKKNEQQLWAERVVKAVNCTFPEVEYENLELCDKLLPHAQTCAEYIGFWDIETEESAKLLNASGSYLHERARFKESETLLKSSLVIRKKILEPEHFDISESLNNLAKLYKDLGRYSESEPLYLRALEIRENTLSLDDPAIAESLNNLAELFRTLGKYSEAESLHVRALEIRENISAPDDPIIAESLNNLALVYSDLDKYSEAESLHVRALEIRENISEPDDPIIAESLNNLATVYRDLDRYSEAELLCIRALEITEKALGPEHPDVGTRLNNLATVYRDLDRYSEAEPLHIRALEITEKALGPEHPHVGTCLNNLTIFFHEQHKYLKAKPYYERAIRVTEKIKGENSLELASLLERYASLLDKMKRNREATTKRNRAKRIRSKIENETKK